MSEKSPYMEGQSATQMVQPDSVKLLAGRNKDVLSEALFV